MHVQTTLKRLLTSPYLSARPHGTTRHPFDGFFMNFDIRVLFWYLLRKFRFDQNLTRITDSLHEHQYTFMIISFSNILGIRNVSEKICRESKKKIRILLSTILFCEYRAVYEMCGKIPYSWTGHLWQYGSCALQAGYLRLQIHRIWNNYWFSTQQWSPEQASVLRYTYIVCLVSYTCSCYECMFLLFIPQSFDWLTALHLELLQVIIFIAV